MPNFDSPAWFEADYSWDVDAIWKTVRHDLKLTNQLRNAVLRSLADADTLGAGQRLLSNQALIDVALRHAIETVEKAPKGKTGIQKIDQRFKSRGAD